MRSSTKVVWLAYASIALSFIWGSGIVPAMIARRIARGAIGVTPREASDLRGGKLLATIGMWINVVVLFVILWSMISTYVL